MTSQSKKVYDDGEQVVHRATIPDVRSFLDRGLPAREDMDCWVKRGRNYDCKKCKVRYQCFRGKSEVAAAKQRKRNKRERGWW